MIRNKSARTATTCDETAKLRSRQQTVLVVAHAWHSDLFGGAFRVATELAKGLAADGHHVTYLCCNVCDLPERENVDGVEVRRYRVPPRAWFRPKVLCHIRSAELLAKEVAAEFDIVAVSGHSPLQYFGVLRAVPAARRGHCTYVVHSPFADEQLANRAGGSIRWKHRVREWVGSLVDGWCLRSSDTVQCLSQFTGDLLENRYGSWLRTRCVESPGWVETDRYIPALNRNALRGSLPVEWQTEDPILFTVRRLEQRMGLETLIEAAAKIASTRRFRLLIGGSGPEASRLNESIKESGLEDRAFLLGRIPEEQLASCYAAADVFILPTRSLECFGLIVLEALSCRTPVIGSRVGAIPELLSELGDDWMFEPGDSSGLAYCVEQFLDGKLLAPSDLRAISLRYDIRCVLPRWIELCFGSEIHPKAYSLVDAI